MTAAVTYKARGTDNSAATVTSDAFTCTAGNVLVALVLYFDTGGAKTISTPAGFTAAAAQVSVDDGSRYDGGKLFWRVALGTETTVTGTINAAANNVRVYVWEVSGLSASRLSDAVTNSGTASPVVHSAINPGEIALRFVFFSGDNNVGDLTDPTNFTSIQYTAGSSDVYERTSYRVTTALVSAFSDAISGTVDDWFTVGATFGTIAGGNNFFMGADF